jgi:hypothetical protein
VAIKTIHSVVWAFFAGCILAIPLFAWLDRLRIAATLIAVTFVEVLILWVNGWSCPLTGVAARYTSDRRDNFDIYLPEWLARHNKRIFGAIFIGGLLLTASLWYFRQIK